MTSTASAKVALFISGIIIISVGMRRDNATIRWIGIAFLVAAFLLRFFKKDVPE